MGGGVMKKALLLLLVVPLVTAGGYTHGKQTGTCVASPNPVAADDPFVLSATGLDVGYPVILRAIPPVGEYNGSISYGYITDGTQATWSRTFTYDDEGKWAFEFEYRNPASKSRLYQTIAKCSVTVT